MTLNTVKFVAWRAMAVTLTACTLMACTTTVGPIVPTREPNQYTLTRRANNPLVSWVELKKGAFNQAKEYCHALGKKLTQPKITSNHATGLVRPVTHVTFSCMPLSTPSRTK
jgi:hypothetical protein